MNNYAVSKTGGVDTQTLPVVPFGKYKDKSILDLLADEKYVEWLKQQSWFPKQTQIYNIVVHQTLSTLTNAKTPEHNRLQNLFLDENTQKKLLSKIFKINTNKLKQMLADEEFIQCFGINAISDFTPKLDKNSVKFEDKFNWDVVLYNNINLRQSFISNLENELIDKEKYKQQHDIEQKEIYKKKLQLCEDKINLRNKLDKERIEDFEKRMKNYIEQKENNQREVNTYETQLKKYIEKRNNDKAKQIGIICNELRVACPYYPYDTVNNLSFINKDKTLSDSEQQNIKKLITQKIDSYMVEYDKINVKPTKIRKLTIPEIVDNNESIYLDTGNYKEYRDLVECSFLENINLLTLEQEATQEKYNRLFAHISSESSNIGILRINENWSFNFNPDYVKDYEYSFNRAYRQYCERYYENIKTKYENILKKYKLSNDAYVNKINDNQYGIVFSQCYGEVAICCELKPTLSDDYPCVLRKLTSQIELTKNDKTTFQYMAKIYILIIGSFTSIHTSKEQLIAIFKQSNIIIIFTDEILESSTPETNKCINTTSTSQLLSENKLIEENKSLTDNLLQTQHKLLQAEDKIKQLEEEIILLKTQKTPKSIKDYFGKK